MIGVVLRIGWLTLARDRVALVLTFALPLVFFSVFASVFGAMDSVEPRTVTALLVVGDEHPLTNLLAERLREDPVLIVPEGRAPASREDAAARVRRGEARVAIVLPRGLGRALSDPSAPQATVEVLADRSDPLSVGVATGRVEQVTLRLGVGLLRRSETDSPGARDASGATRAAGPMRVEVVDLLGGSGQRPSIAFFAAGLGVMFLMFATGMRGGLLLDEKESGVLTRLLAARMTMTHLLFGRWLFLVAIGCVQVTLMFAWASVAYGLELWSAQRLAGFAATTLVTSAVAAAFGLMLSAACRSRAQLTGVTTVTVLVLCALGGNMFPSFLMPESLQTIGLVAFNAWALHSYQKVFWYGAALGDLWPQLGMLALFGLLFFTAARALAARWQTT